MKKLFIVCVVVLSCAACTRQIPQASYDIIPLPKEVTLTEEKPFLLQPNTVIYYEEGLQREAQFLSEYVNDMLGYALPTAPFEGQSNGIVTTA